MSRRADVAAGLVVSLATLIAAEAAVRMSYDTAVRRVAVASAARAELDVNAAARWAVDARNQAKRDARRWDLEIVRLREEDRNRRRYGDPVGPSYEDLRTKLDDAEILASAARTNATRDNAALLAASLAPATALGAGLVRLFTGSLRDAVRAWITGPIAWLGARAAGLLAVAVTGTMGHTTQEVAAFVAVFVGMGLAVSAARWLVRARAQPGDDHL